MFRPSIPQAFKLIQGFHIATYITNKLAKKIIIIISALTPIYWKKSYRTGNNLKYLTCYVIVAMLLTKLHKTAWNNSRKTNKVETKNIRTMQANTNITFKWKQLRQKILVQNKIDYDSMEEQTMITVWILSYN